MRGSLPEGLQTLLRSETLSRANAWVCGGCGDNVQAEKTFQISAPPEVLIVNLKRFEARGAPGLVSHQPPRKIDVHVAFDTILSLAPRVHYDLKALLVHHGSATKDGHYDSYGRDSAGNWAHFNDSVVRECGVDEVLASKPYVLFYVRRSDTDEAPRGVGDDDSSRGSSDDDAPRKRPRDPSSSDDEPPPPQPKRRRSVRLSEAAKRAKNAETSDEDPNDATFNQPDDDEEEEEPEEESDGDDMPHLGSGALDGRQSLLERIKAAERTKRRSGDGGALAELRGAPGPDYADWQKGDDLPIDDRIKWQEWGHPLDSDAFSYGLVQRLIDACVTAGVKPPTSCDEYTLADYEKMLRDWRASLHTRYHFKRAALKVLADTVTSLLGESVRAMRRNATPEPDSCKLCVAKAMSAIEFTGRDEITWGTPHEDPYFSITRAGDVTVLIRMRLHRDHLWLCAVFRGWLCHPCNQALRNVDVRSTEGHILFQSRVGADARD